MKSLYFSLLFKSGFIISHSSPFYSVMTEAANLVLEITSHFTHFALKEDLKKKIKTLN